MFPRSGGIWDQDPVLMHHFRIIKKFDHEWKNSQQEIEYAKQNVEAVSQGKSPVPQGVGGIGTAMNQFLHQLEEDGEY